MNGFGKFIEWFSSLGWWFFQDKKGRAKRGLE